MIVSSKLHEMGQSVVIRPASSEHQYRAYLFGPFRVIRDDQPLGKPIWRRNKAKTLLKWFLLNPEKFFSVDQLSRLLWPGLDQSTAVRNLHVAIHYLRHLLEPDLDAGQKSTFIRCNKHKFYSFHLNENWWIDIFVVDQLFSKAKEAELHNDVSGAITYYRELLDYYTFGFLPEEIYEDIFSSYRRQYDRVHVQILEKLMQLCAQANMPDDILTYGFQALSLDPYCEAATIAIVQVYAQQENMASAIRLLDTFQALLKQDLHIVPSEELRTLRDTILRNY